MEIGTWKTQMILLYAMDQMILLTPLLITALRFI